MDGTPKKAGKTRFIEPRIYLCERAGVELVLAGDLETDVASGSGVPSGLCAGLDLGVDLVVVASGEDAQVVGGGDGGRVGSLAVAGGEGVFGDGGLSDIVAALSTDEETLVAEGDIEGGGRALEEVGEQAGVDVGLLVQQVELATIRLLRGQVVGQDLSLQTLGQVVLQLQLCVKAVGCRPCLREGQACGRWH